MKKIIALIICLTVAAVCFADPVVGYWLSIDENTNRVTAGWQIYIENDKLFGRIVSLADEPRGTIADQCRESYSGFPLPGRVNQMQVAGPPWIFNLTRQSEGRWSGGRIINPEDGKIYNCRIIFHPAGSRSGNRAFQHDTLEMRGEVVSIGAIGAGRSQFWRRTDERTARNLWPN
jgi:uncharacterized protein (DUF2147 family)